LSEAQFEQLAAEVSARRKDPWAAVDEILARAGLELRYSYEDPEEGRRPTHRLEE
jgi:hypothetical protein